MVQRMLGSCLILVVVAFAAACDRTPKEPGAPKPPAPAPTPSAPVEPLSKLAAPARVIAIGDLHGDLHAARTALKVGGAIDDEDHWIGGALVVVQTGDQVDRGDHDKEIIDLFETLQGEAKAAGGAVVPLIGNHEAMNVSLQLDYVTPAGFKLFEGLPGLKLDDPKLSALPSSSRARGAAFMPGGPYGKKLGARDAVAIVGDTLFVHGGVEPKHVKYGLPRINKELSLWMKGESPSPSEKVVGEGGVLWVRRYSASPDAKDCAVLSETLALTGTRRMVMGHTIQREGITSACDAKAWRIDTGMARGHGGNVEVLEIAGDQVKVLKAKDGSRP